MTNPYSICYVSNVSSSLAETEIEHIFNTTLKNNITHNITGILLHDLGHFFQVLEGEEQHVKSLFESKIRNDFRHSNITTIFEGRLDQRLFFGYDSKFNVVKTSNDLERIKAYLITKTGKAPDKILRVLRPFMTYQST